MDNQSKMDTSSSSNLIDIMKRCHDFSDLPDDLNLGIKSYSISNLPPNIASMSEADRNIMRYEEYLRSKWQCAEAMPESFDPEKLELIRKMRYGALKKKIRKNPSDLEINRDGDIGEQSLNEDAHPYHEDDSSKIEDSDIDSLINSIIESLNTKEHIEGDESDAIVDSTSNEDTTKARPRSKSVSRSAPAPTEQKKEPRIKSGSKPPLSRSAFARGGETGVDGNGEGVNGTTPIVYPRAPKYFPFKGRAGKKQK
ncbi:hypothetical protein F4810DRAFT_232947 [Camillea tinctor]|nr:hypothetical protein F4810DRAFT_232947 [Camillea tinctor]